MNRSQISHVGPEPVGLAAGSELMYRQLIPRLVEVQKKRRALLRDMKAAVIAQDREKVFFLAEKLTGVNHEERD